MHRRIGTAMVMLGLLAIACSQAEGGQTTGDHVTPRPDDPNEALGAAPSTDPTMLASDAATENDAAKEGDSGEGGLVGQDKNGVGYIAIPGFVYATERFDWNKNFKSNGSMRHDFEGAADENQAVVGYFKVDGPDDEEISAKLGGGPHSDDNPEWADCYDIGLIDFRGSGSRLRYEHTHPKGLEDGPSAKVNGVGDIRNKWVGAMGMKLNLDTDGDGKTDKVRVLAWIDPDGLDAAGKPKNGWKKTFDATIALADVELKSPTVPYVTTIGEADTAQATIRIDEQDADSYEYKYVAYRSLKWK